MVLPIYGVVPDWKVCGGKVKERATFLSAVLTENLEVLLSPFTKQQISKPQYFS